MAIYPTRGNAVAFGFKLGDVLNYHHMSVGTHSMAIYLTRGNAVAFGFKFGDVLKCGNYYEFASGIPTIQCYADLFL